MTPPRNGHEPRLSLSEFHTEDAPMAACLKRAAVAAATDLPVLILGESGTGKTLLANAIHNSSSRAARSFISFNGAALSDTLLDSQLFGHERGAFTGAHQRVKGKFELADGGTLFIDEIADLSTTAQSKILRAIEYGEFERLGGEAIHVADVRLISATHYPLQRLAESQRFRHDLFFRIKGIAITIPPLRERSSDISMLAKYFIERFCRDLNKKPLMLAPSAVEELHAYSWPGNVRELQNCIERAVILTEGDTIHARHLNLSFRDTIPSAATTGPWDEIDLSGSLAEASRRILTEVERRKIEQALKDAGSNKGRAADILQVSYKTFTAKLREYGFE